MIDTLTKHERSERMSRVRSKNTGVELKVRRLLFSLGYRYRLHVRGLPGSPDLVFSARRKVIFVHGCFWHGHRHCRLARIPKSNVEFWAAKIESNAERDKRAIAELESVGWKVHTVWECELSDPALASRLQQFLGPPRR